MSGKTRTRSQAARVAERNVLTRSHGLIPKPDVKAAFGELTVQGAKELSSYSDGTVGARVKAKNEALRAVNASPAESADPAVDTAMEDLVGMLQGTSIGGRRRHRGGATLEAIGSLFSGLRSKAAEAGSSLDSAAATLVNNLGTVGAVGGTVAVLNHPSVVGNMAQLFAEVLKKGSPAVITSTWGDWGEALNQLASAAGTVVATLGAQTQQGPVVPVAIAVLVTMIRGNKSGRSFTQVLKDDASALMSSTARAVTGQIQAATDAYGKEAAAKGIRQLKEIAGRIDRPAGPGAMELSAAANAGVPAARGTEMGIGLVAAKPSAVARVPEAARGIAAAASAPGREWEAAQGLMGLSVPRGKDAAAVEGEVAMRGGRRRKTKKRVSKKRRATRRQPKFVY